MIDAGKQRRRRVQRGVAAAAAAADAGVGFAAPAAPLPRANSGPTVPATGGSRLNPVVGPRGLERQASTSFLGRAANGSKSSGGLVRSVSLGGGGASRSFVFGGGGDSQSMWEKDAEENGRETPPTVLKELGADDNARTDFGWAPRDKFPASKQAPSRLAAAPAGPDRACSACFRRRRTGRRSSADRTRSRRVSRLRRTSSFGPRRRADETRRARERMRVELRMRLRQQPRAD